MKITREMTDQAVREELGRRLRRTRLRLNHTQQDIADEAGISRPALRRLEAGQDVTCTTLIRVLRTLDLTAQFDALVPDPQISPIEILRSTRGRERQRARPPRADQSTKDATSIWNDNRR